MCSNEMIKIIISAINHTVSFMFFHSDNENGREMLEMERKNQKEIKPLILISDPSQVPPEKRGRGKGRLTHREPLHVKSQLKPGEASPVVPASSPVAPPPPLL